MAAIVQDGEKKISSKYQEELLIFTPPFSVFSTWIVYAAPIAVCAHGLMALQYTPVITDIFCLHTQASLQSLHIYFEFYLTVVSKVYLMLLLSLMHSAQAVLAIPSPAAHGPCPTAWTLFLELYQIPPVPARKDVFISCIWFHSEKKERDQHTPFSNEGEGRRNDRQAPQLNEAYLSWRTLVHTRRCQRSTGAHISQTPNLHAPLWIHLRSLFVLWGFSHQLTVRQAFLGGAAARLHAASQPPRSVTKVCRFCPVPPPPYHWHPHKKTAQVATYLPGWQRWGCGCRTFWWWYQWTAAWWVSCPGGGCFSETQASGAVDCGAGPSARWLCSSPSNGQTPYATTQEHNRDEASSPEGQGEAPRAEKEGSKGYNPVGHPHMDTHVRPQG